MVPTIDGRMHHFINVGLYDALFVMQDTESRTLWNHITGEALYGPLVGRSLGPLGNLLQMSVTQALEVYPEAQVAISERMYFAGGRQFGTAGGFGPRGGGPARGDGPASRGGGSGAVAGPGAGRGRGSGVGPDTRNAALMPMFEVTLGKEDARRPRMDLGLGIWTDGTRRYYPVAAIRERGDAFVHELDGRPLLVYVDPDTNTPAALFVEARSAKVDGQQIRLDTGAVVRSGVLYGADGRRLAVTRPQQIFTRWYGFALTFPGPQVYGE